VASVVTVLQRVHAVRTSPGAMDLLESSGEEKPAAGDQ
jgi:CDP-diacylglycerol--glycerol-3-phosphate 3-phosphatidyltransferase/CDP-diacylglycerol--inositol 3-phosphatidyltransferase